MDFIKYPKNIFFCNFTEKDRQRGQAQKDERAQPKVGLPKFERLLVATRAIARLEIIQSRDGAPESTLTWVFIDDNSNCALCACRSRYEEEDKAERMRLATRTSNGCQKKKKGKGKKKSGKGKKKATNDSQNVNINIDETQDMEMIPNVDWQETASLLYGVAILMFKHNMEAEQVRKIVLQMGEEEARKYFLELAMSS